MDFYKGDKMKTNKIKRVERKNLSQKAYHEIRQRIYNNEIKSGELIKESLIAEELGISRTPVREAIRMLESEQVLEVRDGIGTYVKILSFKDIRDIFEVREALESIAATTAIYRIPKSTILELEDELSDLLEKYESGILKEKEFVDTDMKLHQLLIYYSENDFIKILYEGINLKIKQFQFVSYSNLNNSRESILQHLNIIKLIKENKLGELLDFLKEHINWSLKGLL